MAKSGKPASAGKKVKTSVTIETTTYETLRAAALKRAAPGQRPNMGPIIDELVETNRTELQRKVAQ